VDEAHLNWTVRRLDETTSTNSVALEAAMAGEPEGLVVVADHQTAGRGRLDRSWVAPAGTALLLSLLLRPGGGPAAGDQVIGGDPAVDPAARAHLTVTALGCAAAAACDLVAGFQPGLKWPNDLVAGGGKLGGILAETSANLAVLVIGLGLNLRRPSDRPPDLAATAVDLEVLAGQPVGRDVLLEAILGEFGARYERVRVGDTVALLAEYRARCVTIGQRVRIDQPSGTVEGLARGIGADGSLTVDTGAGDIVSVTVGDVIHLRPA
jgi:BirA family biotin operon repressor/biotin-[acetyl-CoA-carboxylase] ligase